MAWNRLSTYKTQITRDEAGNVGVRYHSTDIVKTYDECGRRVIELDTGGETGDWHTASRGAGSVTTKKKMNQASRQFGLGYSVHQHKHRWYVTTKAGVFPYDDNVFVIDAETGVPWGVVELFTHKQEAA